MPIHAVGFQGYFELNAKMSDVADAMRRFQDLGIKVHLTEVAVRVHATIHRLTSSRPKETNFARFSGPALTRQTANS